VVVPEARREPLEMSPSLALLHDIEGGLGHLDGDPDFARRIHARARDYLDMVLRVERAVGLRGTYAVVGLLMDECRGPIEADGHGLAFHALSHGVDPDVARRFLAGEEVAPELVAAAGPGQVAGCRPMDYRVRGYHPPRSILTDETHPRRLSHHNFEWLACGESTLAMTRPHWVDHVVHFPVVLDDSPLHRGQLDWEGWQTRALEAVRARPFAVIGLHDCYAGHWLDRLAPFLDDLMALALPITLDEACDRIFLARTV
jgi:hypothetical protein